MRRLLLVVVLAACGSTVEPEGEDTLMPSTGMVTTNGGVSTGGIDAGDESTGGDDGGQGFPDLPGDCSPFDPPCEPHPYYEVDDVEGIWVCKFKLEAGGGGLFRCVEELSAVGAGPFETCDSPTKPCGYGLKCVEAEATNYGCGGTGDCCVPYCRVNIDLDDLGDCPSGYRCKWGGNSAYDYGVGLCVVDE